MLPTVAIAKPGYLMELTGLKSIQHDDPQNEPPITCAGSRVAIGWCSSLESSFLPQAAIIRSLVSEYGQNTIWAIPGSLTARTGKSYGNLSIPITSIRRVQPISNPVESSSLVAS